MSKFISQSLAAGSTTDAALSRKIGASVIGGGIIIATALTGFSALFDNDATTAASQRSACIGRLLDSLNDPWSLQVHGVSNDGSQLDYSAKNGFGGRVRGIYNCN